MCPPSSSSGAPREQIAAAKALIHNQLSALPEGESFGLLIALQTLELENNQLSELPESFGQLIAVQTLGLEDNQLSGLPVSFGQLLALQRLGLVNNQLRELPASFGSSWSRIRWHLTSISCALCQKASGSSGPGRHGARVQ